MNTRRDYELTSDHFTEAFVERLRLILTTVPSREVGGISAEGLQLLMQARVGAAAQTVPIALSCLDTMRLVTTADGMVARSRLGDRVRREMRRGGSHALATAIIRSGMMAGQVRAIRLVLRRNGDGYECGRHAAQSAAPQLFGLLARMPDVMIGGQILIGRESSLELDSIWNELTPASRVDWEDIEKRRKAIGERAELYSMQLERSAQVGAFERIVWVSRDDDSLGYDIEIRGRPTRHVEVKGSAGPEIVFLLSSNEYSVARRVQENYEIQFWGKINLRSDPRDDFDRLTAMGYPIRIHNPVSALANPPWSIEPSVYRVSRR